MTRPLNDYYINSYKNSYSADCNLYEILNVDSDEVNSKFLPIEFWLDKGCRFVELDIWVRLYFLSKLSLGSACLMFFEKKYRYSLFDFFFHEKFFKFCIIFGSFHL